jgi:cytochrome oxidase assembly protein ShyY1
MTVGRLLLTRRWVGLTLLAVVIVVAFAWLGAWQFGRSYRAADGFSDEPLAVPIAALAPVGGALAPGSVDRQATATGQYVASRQQVVAGHTLDGSAVSWVVTPLALTDGTVVQVVRGWVTAAETGLESPPAGTVTVTGRIQPSAAPPAGPGSPTRAGLLLRTAQSPPDPLSLQPVPSAPLATTGGTKQFYLQNAIYTSQWWIFAVLVVVYWWRLLRDERAARSAPVAVA